MDENFSDGWQARAGARAFANAAELQLRLSEAATSSLVLIGRYLRRSRRYAQLTQVQLARAAGVSQSTVSRVERGTGARIRLAAFVAICAALGRAFPLGACPHDHPCAWPPVRPPERQPVDGEAFLEYLLRQAGEPEPLDPGAGAHDATDIEIDVQLDEIRPLAGREAAAIGDAEQSEGIRAGGRDGSGQSGST